MTRTRAFWLAGLVLVAPFAVAGGAPAATIEINLLYVHGVKSCQAERQNAQGSFTDLEQAVNADLPGRIASYQAAHPGTTIVTHSGRANLYTATPSGYHPSDSPDPINMDDWKVGDPGCSTTQQGDPCTTAYEWRYRLAQEIDRLYPAPASNVILIGHSSGARVARRRQHQLGRAESDRRRRHHPGHGRRARRQQLQRRGPDQLRDRVQERRRHLGLRLVLCAGQRLVRVRGSGRRPRRR